MDRTDVLKWYYSETEIIATRDTKYVRGRKMLITAAWFEPNVLWGGRATNRPGLHLEAITSGWMCSKPALMHFLNHARWHRSYCHIHLFSWQLGAPRSPLFSLMFKPGRLSLILVWLSLSAPLRLAVPVIFQPQQWQQGCKNRAGGGHPEVCTGTSHSSS